MNRQDEPELALEQMLDRVRSFFGRFGFRGARATLVAVLVLLGVAVATWLGSGLYTVSAVGGEVAVLRLFGKYTGEADEGLHWFWPAPIGTRNIVQAEERRLMELGFRGTSPFSEESLMITGDENIVDVQLLIQYNIQDPTKFLFKVIDPGEATLRDASETSLRQVVGSRPIDDVLTNKKEEVQTETQERLQKLLDDYLTGIRVTEVKLQNVNPPPQVQDAFADVVRAKEDKERIINLADAYKEDVLPKAEGSAARLRENAEAYRAERVNHATGEAAAFTAVLLEYRKAKNVTRQRIYLETMEEIFTGIEKNILPAGSDIVIVRSDDDRTVTPLPQE